MPLPPWTPDLVTLDLLLSVEEHGSIGHAASAHGLSQPSASARLTHLERRIGFPVLVRDTQGSRLTPAGLRLAALARDVVDTTTRMTEEICSLRTATGQRLKLAASFTVAEFLLPRWLVDLRQHNSNLEITAEVANSMAVCHRLRAGAIELGFVEMPEIPSDLSSVRVGTDDVVLAAAPSIAAQLCSRTPEEIMSLPLLVRERGSGTRDTFLNALEGATGRSPLLPHGTVLGSTATILSLAKSGGGVAVVGRSTVTTELASRALVTLETPALNLTRDLSAVWLGADPSGPARELINRAIDSASRAN